MQGNISPVFRPAAAGMGSGIPKATIRWLPIKTRATADRQKRGLGLLYAGRNIISASHRA